MNQYKNIQGKINIVAHSIAFGISYNIKYDVLIWKNGSNTKSAIKVIIPIIKFLIITHHPIFGYGIIFERINTNSSSTSRVEESLFTLR